MFSAFAYQLPFSVCLVWFVMMLFKGHKDHSDRLFTVVMALLAVCFLCGSNFLSYYPDYERQVIMNLFLQLTSLSVGPVVCLYIRSLYDERKESLTSYLMLLPAILVATSSLVVTLLLGVERSALLVRALFNRLIIDDRLDVLERAYVLLSYKVYYLLFAIILVLTIVFLFSRLFAGKFKFSHIPVFLRGNKASFVANILCLFFVIYFILWGVAIIFQEKFFDIYSAWSALFAVVVALIIFLVGYVSAIPSLPGGYVNMERLKHPFGAVTQSPGEFLIGIDSGPVANVPKSGYDKIMESFKATMITEQGFLNPMMSIDEISRQLNTNRTYVSKLVNIYYGMPFREYLNKLRIDYSKQLMIDEPDAVIDYISVKSGFQSSTQFIRKFKELEGVTPTVWRSNQRRKR